MTEKKKFINLKTIGIIALVLIVLNIVIYTLMYKNIITISKSTFFTVEILILIAVFVVLLLVYLFEWKDSLNKSKEKKNYTQDECIQLFKDKSKERFQWELAPPHFEDKIRVGDEPNQVDVFFAIFQIINEKEINGEKPKVLWYTRMQNPDLVLHRRYAERLTEMESIEGIAKLRAEIEAMAWDLAPNKRKKTEVKVYNPTTGQFNDLNVQ